jgi:hypothetical protein
MEAGAMMTIAQAAATARQRVNHDGKHRPQDMLTLIGLVDDLAAQLDIYACYVPEGDERDRCRNRVNTAITRLCSVGI